jgi:hypothetical protein
MPQNLRDKLDANCAEKPFTGSISEIFMCVFAVIKIPANPALCKEWSEPVISRFLRFGASLNIPQSGVFVKARFRCHADIYSSIFLKTQGEILNPWVTSVVKPFPP